MKSKSLILARYLSKLLPESSCFGLKNFVYRLAGAKIGRNVRIYSSAKILGIGELEIGDDVHIGTDVLISSNAEASIVIGSHVDIGPGVMLLTGSHKIDIKGEHIGGEGVSSSISIGDGSWLGARATILPGVVLPKKTLVAAGSVVTKSPERRHVPILLAGVPADIKKEISG